MAFLFGEMTEQEPLATAHCEAKDKYLTGKWKASWRLFGKEKWGSHAKS
jgi:hypothetical protein